MLSYYIGVEGKIFESRTLEVCYLKFHVKPAFIRYLKSMECFRLLLDHLAWFEYQFLSDIRDSRKAGSLWGMMSGVWGVRKSIHQSWLAKGLGSGLGLQCWGFMGVHEEILPEEASTLQIGSVAFPPGQCTSPHLHPCHKLFDQDGYQDSCSPSL